MTEWFKLQTYFGSFIGKQLLAYCVFLEVFDESLGL